MPKIVHFEINADDIPRAKAFYEKVFKWKIQSWEGNPAYHVIEAGEESEAGINGGLQKREDSADQIFNYISVSSVDDSKKLIEENGGTIESPRITIPGVGHFYMFKDPEGNKLGVMEEDKNAK